MNNSRFMMILSVGLARDAGLGFTGQIARTVFWIGVFGGQHVGIREVANGIWLVSFMNYDLGFFDENENRVEPVGNNPFAPKL